VIDRNEKLDDQAAPVRLAGPATVPGNWDRMRLDQVIANLLANAAKHSSGNPIEVIVSADEAVARVEVRDYGVGIPPDKLETIFEPFETTALPNHGHFGLGLWVVSLIVRSMAGKVSVSSTEGEGSSFVVELPRR
jgi:signal transduction histidine kinase